MAWSPIRPARGPKRFVALARAIAKAVSDNVHESVHAHVWDCLVAFDDGDPPTFILWVVVEADVDRDATTGSFSEAMLAVPVSEGVLSEILVVTKDELSLSVVENSYAADLTQLTPS